MATAKSTTTKTPAKKSGPTKAQKEAISSGSTTDEKVAKWAIDKGFASRATKMWDGSYQLILTGKKG